MYSNTFVIWPVFVTAIAALFGVASLSALMNTHRYARTERNALWRLQAKLKQALSDTPPQTATSNDIGPRAHRLIPIADLDAGPRSFTLIADRLASIQKMRESHVKVNLAALQHMTLAREASRRWLALPGFAANACILCGLLGTVVGLSWVVQQISAGLPADMTQLTPDAWLTAATQIRGMLGGMKTAFFSTTAGLTASLILSALNHRLSRSQSVLLDQLDRFTVEDLLPATVPATEDESLLERVSLQLEASCTGLTETLQSNRGVLEQLGTVEKGIIEIVDSVRQSTHADHVGPLSELLGSVAGLIDQIATLNRSVVQVTNTLPGLVQESQRANKETLEHIEKVFTKLPAPLPPGVTPRWSTFQLILGGLGALALVLALLLR